MKKTAKDLLIIEERILELEEQKKHFCDVRNITNSYGLENATLNLVKRENGETVDYKCLTDMDIFSGVKTFIRNNMNEKIVECQKEIEELRITLKNHNL